MSFFTETWIITSILAYILLIYTEKKWGKLDNDLIIVGLFVVCIPYVFFALAILGISIAFYQNRKK